jgi:flagellar L-ring protein precursor FlgH
MKQNNCQCLMYVALAFVLVTSPGSARNKRDQLTGTDSREDYIERAWPMAVATQTPGSLWAPQGSFANLVGDDKARNINDTIIINVVEETTAAADATVKSARTVDASAGKSQGSSNTGSKSTLQSIISPQSSLTLNGQAKTTSDSKFSAVLAGQVVGVLPNGFLVVEAVRHMAMNNQRQTLLVRGIVRPSDIALDNSVLSTRLGSLEVVMTGKGVLSDGVRQPSAISRFLLKIVRL